MPFRTEHFPLPTSAILAVFYCCGGCTKIARLGDSATTKVPQCKLTLAQLFFSFSSETNQVYLQFWGLTTNTWKFCHFKFSIKELSAEFSVQKWLCSSKGPLEQVLQELIFLLFSLHNQVCWQVVDAHYPFARSSMHRSRKSSSWSYSSARFFLNCRTVIRLPQHCTETFCSREYCPTLPRLLKTNTHARICARTPNILLNANVNGCNFLVLTKVTTVCFFNIWHLERSPFYSRPTLTSF